MFSDESRFCLQELVCTVKVWRGYGECYADCCTDRVAAFGGDSVMVWGGISLTGKTTCHHWRKSQCMEMRFCYQWQSHISTVWDQTVLEMTMLDPTEQGLSETNDLPAVLTLNHYQTNTHPRGSIFVY